MNLKGWYVYIISNNSHTTYIGMANDVPRRVSEHKTRKFRNAFTSRYTFDRLVYWEFCGTQRAAAKREREIKSWRREKKVALIQARNPNWIDLHFRWQDLLRLD